MYASPGVMLWFNPLKLAVCFYWYRHTCASLALCLCEFGTILSSSISSAAVSIYMLDTAWPFPTLLSHSVDLYMARSLLLRAWHFGFQPFKYLRYFICCVEPRVWLHVWHESLPNAASTSWCWCVPRSLFYVESVAFRLWTIVSHFLYMWML